MVCFLILVQMLDVIGCYVACPLNVKVLIISFHHIEARIFASVIHSVVNVSSI